MAGALRQRTQTAGLEASRGRPAAGADDQRFLSAPFLDCPVKISVGVLGKKWTLRILGQVGVYGRDRFNRMLIALPGISPKVLASQLNDLEKAGLLARITVGTSPKRVRWALTERGRDAMAILIVMTGFASKYYPDLLYDDGNPRRLNQILDKEGRELIRALL